MTTTRKVEIYSAGCPVCGETIAQVRALACPSCEVTVVDMHDPAVAERAAALGIRSLPAVAVDGRLADCCAGRGVDLDVLRRLGVGVPR